MSIPVPEIPALPSPTASLDEFDAFGDVPDEDDLLQIAAIESIPPVAPSNGGLVPHEPEVKPKSRGPRGAAAVVELDWMSLGPRKEDDFEGGPPASLSLTIERIRGFVNQARDKQLYGDFYAVLQYKNRTSALNTVKKIREWKDSPTNKYGVRDGESLDARCETINSETYRVWVALLNVTEGDG